MKSTTAILLFCLTAFLPENVIPQELSGGQSLEIKMALSELLGEEESARYKEIIPPDKKITWEVYLPDNESAEIPGVIVYVSPRQSGKMDGQWRKVMDQQNLIYIGANESGNRIPVNRRMIMALMGLKALEKRVVFTSERLYVTGFSGGGRVASVLASQYPEVFTGAIYICGVDFWQDDQTPRVERLVQNRFVFLTGTGDFNRIDTTAVYHRYLKAGAVHSTLMVIPGLSHDHPDAKGMTKALEFLNGEENLD